MAYGLTEAGYVRRTLNVIKLGLEARFRAEIAQELPLLPQSQMGVAIGIFSELMDELDAGAEAVYLAFDERSATGAALENLGAITGSTRRQASPSTVVVTATGDEGTVLPGQRAVSVPATGARFVTAADDEVTLTALPAWQASHAYALGERVTTSVGGAARAYQVVDAGASAAAGPGPAGTGPTVVDGGVVWRYLGEGGAAADVTAECTVTGPVPALAYTVTGIETPVSGWRSVVNVQDAVLGANRETDAEYRVRRRQELRGLGRSSVDAVRELLLDQELVPGVRAVTVFENDGDEVDADGVPPHALEALVEGGEDQAIVDTLWFAKAGGIATHGTTVGTAEDSEGVSHTVRFTRPTILPIYITATVQVTPDAPADDAQAKAQLAASLLAYGDALPSGLDVVKKKAEGALTGGDDVKGWVFDVPSFLIGVAPDALGTANIPVTTRQRADFDTGRINLTLQRLTKAQL